MAHSLIVLAAESASSEGKVNAWLVGGVTLVVLLLMLLALASFGGGREHS